MATAKAPKPKYTGQLVTTGSDTERAAADKARP